jgi:hypothetical protein
VVENLFLDSLLLLFYGATLFFVVWYLFHHTRQGWGFESFFLAIFLLFYVVIPIAFIINNNLLLQPFQDPDIELYSDEYTTYSFTSFTMILIFLFFFFMGKNMASSYQFKLQHIKERYLSIYLFDFSLLKAIGLFFSFLSFISMFIYASAFGGFEQAIYYAEWVDSGAVEEAVLSTQYIFVYRFIYFSIISFTIYMFIKEKSNLLYITTLLILPLITTFFSRIFLFSGKESIIEIFLLLLFYQSIKNRSSYFIQIFIFSLVLYIALPIMDTLMISRQDLSNITIEFSSILKFLEYFTFPQISLEFALNKEYDLFFFNDFIYGLRGNIVPFSWLESYNISTVQLNTYHFLKEYKSTVPPGVLAFSYYSLGVVGIVLIGFLSGFILKKLDALFIAMCSINSSFGVFYALLMASVFTFVRTGIPELNLYDTSLIVLILTIIFGFEFSFKKVED